MNLKQYRSKYPSPQKIADSSGLADELNSLLAEEFQAWYQYFIVQPFLVGNNRVEVQQFFEKAANDELLDHAKTLMNRMSELGCECTLKTPDSWKDYSELSIQAGSYGVEEQISLNKKLEIGAIEHYQRVIELAESLGDTTTIDILKKIKADEEQHLSVLNKFIKDVNSNK